MGLDLFVYDYDVYGLLFVNKIGCDCGVCVEVGVFVGLCVGVVYVFIVCFDDFLIMYCLCVYDVFWVFGVEFMEYIY